MLTIFRTMWIRVAAVLILPVLALGLMAQQTSSLSISGQPGQAQVVQVQGRNFVEVDGLARIVNGSISFSGNQIVLTLPGSNGSAAPDSAAAPPAAATQGLSKGFLNAGIEAMSELREWHAALKAAVERQYPISNDWLAPMRRQTQSSLRTAEVAASTDADKNAFPLLANEFNNMVQLSDKYAQMAGNMTYIDPNGLNNDPVEKKLMSCAHSLVAMASSGQFFDDGSCR